MTSTPRKPQPLYLIVATWLVAGMLLASGVVLAMTLSQAGNGWPSVGVLVGSLIAFGVVQRIGLAAAHDYADARRPHHREADTHRRPASTLPPLITPPNGHAVVDLDDTEITAVARTVGVYVPRHGCDTDTAVMPAVAAGRER